MSLIPFAIFAAVAAGLGYLFFQSTQKTITQLLEGVQRRYPLKISPGGLFSLPEARGSVRGHTVSVTHESVGVGKSRTSTLRLEVVYAHPERSDLTITGEGFLTRIGKALGESDLTLGDPVFDRDLYLEGSSLSYFLSRMNAPTRASVLSVQAASFNNHFQFTGTRGRVNIQSYFGDDGHYRVTRAIGALLDVADAMSDSRSTRDRLADHVVRETAPITKTRMLEAFVRSTALLDSDDPVVHHVLESRDLEHHYVVYRGMGKQGVEKLPALFGRAPEPLRCRMLDDATQAKDPVLYSDALVTVLSGASRRERSAILRYLAQVGDKSAAPVLHGLLSERLGTDSMKEVVAALARCGQYESIELLSSLKKPLVSRVIETAIAEIQQRIGTGDAGWVSLAESGTEGRLSIAGELEDDD